MRVWANSLFVVPIFLFSTGAGAQNPQKQPDAAAQSPAVGHPVDRPVDRIDTQVVNLDIRVVDQSGNIAAGLKREDFEVTEDKIKVELTHFTSTDAPIYLGGIFDVSGSMKEKSTQAYDALKTLLHEYRDDDKYFLLTFNSHPTVSPWFYGADSMIQKLTLQEYKGQTAVLDAALKAIEVQEEDERQNPGHDAKRALLLASDGQTNSDRFTFREVRKRAAEANIQIFTFGFRADPLKGKQAAPDRKPSPVILSGGPGIQTRSARMETPDYFVAQGLELLQSLSDVTRGAYFEPKSFADLEDATAAIHLSLRNTYSAGYEPNDLASPSEKPRCRKISVKIPKYKNLKALTRECYYR